MNADLVQNLLNSDKDVMIEIFKILPYETIRDTCAFNPALTAKCNSIEERLFRILLQRDFNIAAGTVAAGKALLTYLERRRQLTFIDVYNWLSANGAGKIANLFRAEIQANPAGAVNQQFLAVNGNIDFILAVPSNISINLFLERVHVAAINAIRTDFLLNLMGHSVLEDDITKYESLHGERLPLTIGTVDGVDVFRQVNIQNPDHTFTIDVRITGGIVMNQETGERLGL